MVQFHFRTSDGPSVGPIGSEEFRQRQEAGEIDDATMVWRSGMVDWLTYADLRAFDQRASEPQPPKRPATPAKKIKAEVGTTIKAGFCACASCRQEWPETLLTAVDGKRICGNCQNLQKEQRKDTRRKAGAGTGVGAWALILLAIVCAGCLTYKVNRYGVRLPKEPVKELTAPSTFGR